MDKVDNDTLAFTIQFTAFVFLAIGGVVLVWNWPKIQRVLRRRFRQTHVHPRTLWTAEAGLIIGHDVKAPAPRQAPEVERRAVPPVQPQVEVTPEPRSPAPADDLKEAPVLRDNVTAIPEESPQANMVVEQQAETPEAQAAGDKIEKRRKIITALAVQRNPTNGRWMYTNADIQSIVNGDINKISRIVREAREAEELVSA